MWQALISPIASLAGSWMESKVEETKAKGVVAKAKADAEAEVMKVAATHEAGWKRSWLKPATIAGRMRHGLSCLLSLLLCALSHSLSHMLSVALLPCLLHLTGFSGQCMHLSVHRLACVA